RRGQRGGGRARDDRAVSDLELGAVARAVDRAVRHLVAHAPDVGADRAEGLELALGRLGNDYLGGRVDLSAAHGDLAGHAEHGAHLAAALGAAVPGAAVGARAARGLGRHAAAHAVSGGGHGRRARWRLAGGVRVVRHGGGAARAQQSRRAEDSRAKQYAAPGGALILPGLVGHRSSFARSWLPLALTSTAIGASG